ncbi:hypothetical protein BH10ACT6_BH10ACT6_01590 [soil metagenome]
MARTRVTGGTLIETRPGVYSVRMTTPDGRKRIVGNNLTKEEAVRLRRSEQVRMDQGTWSAPKKAPLWGEYAPKVVEAHPVKESMTRNNRTHLRRVLAEFNSWPVDRITNTDLNLWWKKHEDRPVNRKNAWTVVRIVMAQAIVDGYISTTPAVIKDSWKDVSDRRPDWSLEDFEAVLRHVEEPAVRTTLEMLWASHGRLGEVLGMNRSDYDAKTGRIRITKSDTSRTTKTGLTRSFRLLETGIDAVDAYLADNPRLPSAPLLSGTRNASRMPRQTVRKAWQRACARPGWKASCSTTSGTHR